MRARLRLHFLAAGRPGCGTNLPWRYSCPVSRLSFIRPLAPATVTRPPSGACWVHEPKMDGYRLQVVKHGSEVRLFNEVGRRNGSRRFPMADGQVLLEHCEAFGLEGVVTKRRDRPYMSGPCKVWTKTKFPQWKRDN